nr:MULTISPECIES: cation-translocating P-type ATPase C-terminal domain-containing protein [Trichococcus]
MGINPASLLLLPLHVVLLELVIDPTCSIVLERQPAESNIMQRPPRNPKEKLLTASMLSKSVIQGLMIFGASFAMYYYFINLYPDNAPLARTMGLSIILLSNVLLVQVNSSNTEFAFKTFMRQIKDKVMWAVIIGTIAGIFIMIYTPLSGFLKLAPLSATQLLLSIGISCVAVLWYELVKAGRYVLSRKSK